MFHLGRLKRTAFIVETIDRRWRGMSRVLLLNVPDAIYLNGRRTLVEIGGTEAGPKSTKPMLDLRRS